MDDHSLWVDDLVSDLAKNYRVILNHDDPILVTAILNKAILDKAHYDHQGLFAKNSQLLQQQFKAQKRLNELLMTEFTQRVVDTLNEEQKSSSSENQANESMSLRGSMLKALLLLMFMFGLVFGILVGRLI